MSNPEPQLGLVFFLVSSAHEMIYETKRINSNQIQLPTSAAGCFVLRLP